MMTAESMKVNDQDSSKIAMVARFEARIGMDLDQRNKNIVQKFDCPFLLSNPQTTAASSNTDEEDCNLFSPVVLGKSISWQRIESTSESDDCETRQFRSSLNKKRMDLGSCNLSDGCGGGENSVFTRSLRSSAAGGRLSMFSSSQKEESSTKDESFFGSFMDSGGRKSILDFSNNTFSRRTSIYKGIMKRQQKQEGTVSRISSTENKNCFEVTKQPLGVSEDLRESEFYVDSLNDRSSSSMLEEGQINDIQTTFKAVKKFSEDNRKSEQQSQYITKPTASQTVGVFNYSAAPLTQQNLEQENAVNEADYTPQQYQRQHTGIKSFIQLLDQQKPHKNDDQSNDDQPFKSDNKSAASQ